MDELKDKNQKQENDELNSQLVDASSGQGYDPDNDLNYIVSPIGAAFIGLVGGFFLYQIVGGLITVLILGLDFESAPVNEMRLMTMAGQILFMLLPALVFSKIIYSDVNKIIRIKIPAWQDAALFIVGLAILTPLLQSYMYIQNYCIEILAKNFSFINLIKTAFDYLDKMLEKTYSNLLSASNNFELAFVVLIVAVIPALAEEALFRGFIQRSFEIKLKPVIAILLTAAFFSLYHVNPFGFIPLFILGAYFGFAAYISRSLVIPVMLHFFNNFAAVFLYHFMDDDGLLKSNSTANPNDLSSFVMTFIILSVLFIGLIFLIIKYYSSKKTFKEV
jgi:hypothetical protein